MSMSLTPYSLLSTGSTQETFKHLLPAKKTQSNSTDPDQVVLKKQSNQGLHCLLFKQEFVNSNPYSQHFI